MSAMWDKSERLVQPETNSWFNNKFLFSTSLKDFTGVHCK